MFILLFLFLSACAARPAPDKIIPGAPPPALQPGMTAGGGWQERWEKALTAARKERKIVVYGLSSAPALKKVAPTFNKKYNLDLEAISIPRGAELAARIFTERRAGLFLPDVYVGGVSPLLPTMKPAGLVDPLDAELILPEVSDPKLWYGGELPWGDKEHLLLVSYAYPLTTLAINTNLVKPDEIKSYYDLLNAKWTGKILLNDPTTSGVGLQGFSALAYNILNLDFFRQLAKQEPMIIKDQRLQVDWLAKGKYAILIFPQSAPVTEYMEAGAPLSLVIPAEGTYLASGGGSIAFMNKAPHPNAARIFINWFLSREAQTLIAAIDGVQSARMDVSTEGLHPLKVRQAGVKYFFGANREEWRLRDPEFIKAATDIFGHLIR